MEPISLIIAALVAGAAKAAGDAAPDAYKALKTLIKSKFAGEPKAELILEEHEKDPETYKVPLKKQLVEAGVDRDEAIIKIAQKLLKQAVDDFEESKYKVEFQGEFKAVQVGDGNVQKNNFC